jgi:hypothetical protein
MDPKFEVIFLEKAIEFLESLEDKEREEQQTLVVSTHGLVKKTNKVPKKELEKAERIMEEYFTEE